MLSAKTSPFFLYFLAGICHVFSMEQPIITRGTYDLLHYPNCDGQKPKDFDCGKIHAERYGENTTCQCRCQDGYVVYRDPVVNGRYDYLVGERGCVWYGYYREGCHFLRRDNELTFGDGSFHEPVVLDLTKAGSMTLNKQDSFGDSGSYCFDPYVRIPGQNRWERVQNVVFGLVSLDPPNNSKYLLSWSFTGSYNIYAYQGLVMKLNFTECGQPNVYCMMAKLAGTYTGTTHCEQRTVNGRCCVFPFTHDGQVYRKCASTSDMPGGAWCAVGLNKSVENGNHKWREFCSVSPTTPSSPTNRPVSKSPPTIHTPPGSSPKKKASTEKRTAKPHSPGTPGSSRDIVDNHPVFVTITVTRNACDKNTRMTTPFDDKVTSGEADPNTRFIVGVVLGILVLLVILALLGFYLRRRKSATRKSRPRKTISKEDLAESPYASIYSTSAPPSTRNQLNHGYQQSIELTDDQAAAVVRRSYLRDSLSSNGGSHFYDSIENKSRPNTGLSCPIYSMPESDYSLIMEKRQTKIDKTLPPVLPVMLSGNRAKINPAKHLYAVLERDNDPLKRPEAIDNDTVFVEANPLYGTNTQYNVKNSDADDEYPGGIAEANPLYGTTTGFKRKLPPPLPPRLYDDPADALPKKPPGKGERDV